VAQLARPALGCSHRTSRWVKRCVIAEALMTTAAQAAAKITLPGASATRDARMFRNSRAFVPRYQKFESISLQQRVG
jgi:hypothetical protein